MRLIIIILLFLSIKGFSQEDNPKIDSLKNVFASAKEDSVKARALYEWNEIIIASDPQLAQTLNEKLDSICDLHKEFLDEQEKNFYWLMKASVYESFGFLELDRQNHDNSIRHYLSAASLYQKLNMMEDYASAHTFVGYNYFRMEELDSSLAYYEPILKLSADQKFIRSRLP